MSKGEVKNPATDNRVKGNQSSSKSSQSKQGNQTPNQPSKKQS